VLDLALVGFIGLFLALGLKRPFFWVLAYIYIDVVAPQKIGWGFIQSLPVLQARPLISGLIGLAAGGLLIIPFVWKELRLLLRL